MSEAAYRAIGGMVVSDHGPIALRQARRLAADYARDAKDGGGWSCRCDHRARSLDWAVAQASAWRRAAGWAEPNDADVREI